MSKINCWYYCVTLISALVVPTNLLPPHRSPHILLLILNPCRLLSFIFGPLSRPEENNPQSSPVQTKPPYFNSPLLPPLFHRFVQVYRNERDHQAPLLMRKRPANNYNPQEFSGFRELLCLASIAPIYCFQPNGMI